MEGKSPWVVPSCMDCNSALANHEQRVFECWGTSLHPDHHCSKGVIEPLLRSMNPNTGKTEREKKFRERKGSRFIAKTKTAAEILQTGQFLPTASRVNLKEGGTIGTLLDETSGYAVARKLCRGQYTYRTEKVMPPSTQFSVDFEFHGDKLRAAQLLLDHGTTYTMSPQFSVRSFHFEGESGNLEFCEFHLWQQVFFYVKAHW